MDRPSLSITYTSGTVKELTIAAPDIIAFERKYDLPMESVERFEHLCFLAWNGETRTNATTLDFDAWLATVEMVALADPKGSSL